MIREPEVAVPGPSFIKEMPGIPMIWVVQEAEAEVLVPGHSDIPLIVAMLVMVEDASSVM